MSGLVVNYKNEEKINFLFDGPMGWLIVLSMKRTKNSKFKAMVGKRIRLARVAAKMKAKDLASFVGVTPSAVCQYEKGKTEPDLETFRAICESTETSADAVLGIKRDTKTVSNDR